MPPAARAARRRAARAGPPRRRPEDRRRADAREIRASSLALTVLRLSRCCSTLKLCTRPSRTIRSSPSIAPGNAQRLDQIGKAARNILAGARIEPRNRLAVLAGAGDRLDADAVPFPFAEEIASARARSRSPSSSACASIAGRKGAGSRLDGLLGAAFEPGEQLGIGRLQAGPDQLDLLRILVAERGGRGLGEPRRDADAQVRRSRA